jgi:predicted extracellular nuclease
VQVIAVNQTYGGRCGAGLVISQVYGAGGTTSTAWRNDFVELHNTTSAPISLSGFSIQYAGATGNSWSSLALSDVTLGAGGYYLVSLGTEGTIGRPVVADQSSTVINMAQVNGKLALVDRTASLSGSCPTANVVDFVAYGSTNCTETAPAPSTSSWLTRGASGCRDSNLVADFTAGSTSTPRSVVGNSAPVLCQCFVNETNVAEELRSCVLDGAANRTVATGTASPLIDATVTQAGLTDAAGFDPSLQVQVGFGPTSANPTTTAGWKWWPSTGKTAGTTSDSYSGVFVAPVSGGWSFGARATRDGVNWTSCDLNGAGSGAGLTFETAQLGALSVP